MNPNIFKYNKNLYLVPILHSKLYFAVKIRKLIKKINPDILAIELPSWMKEPFIKAINRLPEITIITYKQRENNDNYYIIIEPSDPFVEAVRYSLENNKKLVFIDSDTSYYYEYNDPYLENFFLEQESMEKFLDNYKNINFKKSSKDDLREKTMAYRLNYLLKEDKKILSLIGMSHYSGILEHLKNNENTISFHSNYKAKYELKTLNSKDLASVISDFPYLNWMYENYRKDVKFISENNVIKKINKKFSVIKGNSNDYEKLYKETCENLYNHLQEINFLENIDRRNFLHLIYKKVADIYKLRYKENFSMWQEKNIVKFARNISIIRHNRFIPDYFTVIESAKACVDDNYAWELIQILAYYPYQNGNSGLEEIDINTLNNYKSFFVRPKKIIESKKIIKDRKKVDNKNQKFSKDFICSYQPEDIIIENFGNFLKRKAKKQLLSKLTKSEKFSSSFFEGIDIKETIRKQDGIYVKRFDKLSGELGSVIFIFDEDENNERYSYATTWLGEHNQESDMAFYSTALDEDIIGPGISRCEYGGFLLSFPPQRLYDVWADPDYRFINERSQKLLAAGIDYSYEKYIVYVAAKPPQKRIVSWARKNSKDVVYIPIGAFSKSTINKIKFFHILASHKVRDYAKDYIF